MGGLLKVAVNIAGLGQANTSLYTDETDFWPL